MGSYPIQAYISSIFYNNLLVMVAGDRQNIGRGVTFKSFIIILAVWKPILLKLSGDIGV